MRRVTPPTFLASTSSGSVVPAFSAYSFVKVYSSAEWSPLKLPAYAWAWDTDRVRPSC